jgi:hypothetical protein
MTQLLALQRSFQAFVLGGHDAAPPTIAGSASAPAEERLSIYAEAIALRFSEVLGKDYPGVHAMLGDGAFRALAGAYAAAHPSRNHSIRWFGRDLPAFVQTKTPYREHAVIGEMALFEWRKGELIDAADSPLVRVEDIAAIAADQWAGMQPRLVAALRRLTLEWNVPALWSAVDAGGTPPPPTRLERPVQWLLWREGIHIRWRSVDADEAWALQACDDGEDFGFICDGLCERIGLDAAAFRAATYLKQWASDSLLAAL